MRAFPSPSANVILEAFLNQFRSISGIEIAVIIEILNYEACRQLSQMFLAVIFFHSSEYVLAVAVHGRSKEYWWISNFGLLMVIIGEIIRKMAIITAGQSFTHLIKVHHEESHKLITHGVYRFMRHPSYCGFFVWSVGTQVMLCNPLSTIVFALVVWRFFAKRIPYEEYFLRRFFGSEYEIYAQYVPSGVPFVK
ncbi:protein-S-isoprenylcysteine O-methyltransferase A-like isoform X4 [Carica papaya]|uniref:protein-S-isoprenylcysteine O-methyltransferase A-like isoform X4 n=1 Tax=Carica papaya TaxID=3649 RepID=UPI000B8CA5FA|nr:protein-S-isoprenylcysteine O-methyltransferase A-like isoform X4 [Carica papaya]